MGGAGKHQHLLGSTCLWGCPGVLWLCLSLTRSPCPDSRPCMPLFSSLLPVGLSNLQLLALGASASQPPFPGSSHHPMDTCLSPQLNLNFLLSFQTQHFQNETHHLLHIPHQAPASLSKAPPLPVMVIEILGYFCCISSISYVHSAINSDHLFFQKCLIWLYFPLHDLCHPPRRSPLARLCTVFHTTATHTFYPCHFCTRNPLVAPEPVLRCSFPDLMHRP